MKAISNLTNGNQSTNLFPLCTHSDDGVPALSTFGKIAVGLLSGILILTGVCGNAVVCFIVCRKSQMRSAINLLLASMALSDILISVLCFPFPLITFLNREWIFGVVVCNIHSFLFEYFSAVSIFVLLVMSGDRYMIIVKRRDKLTAKFAKIFIGVVWTLPCIIALPPVFGMGEYKLQAGQTKCSLTLSNWTLDIVYLSIKFFVIFIFPFLSMAYIYLTIGNTVRKNLSRVQDHSDTQVSLSIAQMSARLGFVLIPMKSKLNVDVKFKTRTFKTIMLLYVVLALCFSPYSINQFIGSFTGCFRAARDNTILWIAFSKSVINPVIYFFRIKKYREACREILPSSCCRRIFKVGRTSKSRVNPSAAYKYNGEASVITTV